jgi:hypothetical protein
VSEQGQFEIEVKRLKVTKATMRQLSCRSIYPEEVNDPDFEAICWVHGEVLGREYHTAPYILCRLREHTFLVGCAYMPYQMDVTTMLWLGKRIPHALIK